MRSTPVAVIITDAAGKVVPIPEAAKALPGTITENYHQLPFRWGGMQPVVTRRYVPPTTVNLNINWLYLPQSSEHDSVQCPDAPPWLDGLILPREALLLPTTPPWLEAGLEYARALYKPLFDHDDVAAPGLASMALTHPDSFRVVAKAKKVDRSVCARFTLAALFSKWEMLRELGIHVSEEMRIEEYARVAGADISTERGIARVKQIIARGLRKVRQRLPSIEGV